MYPVLIKTASKNFILQTGKTVCANFLRYSSDISNEIELPPEPTTCCMSGCANCVWIEYAETVAKLMDGNCDKARQLVLNKIQDPNLKMFLAIELKNIQYNLEQSRNTNVTEDDKDKEK
ncbi:uncharacterized protein LOC135956064 [Calliphora vicina]|uniref:uncharacterized protein LOC135956064 n=1 Tax=Calliphora vicina TaxID=7373 RepID=UPI00325B541E